MPLVAWGIKKVAKFFNSECKTIKDSQTSFFPDKIRKSPYVLTMDGFHWYCISINELDKVY